MVGIKKIWRISAVRMFYAVTIKKKTPTPFCEIRAFMFTKKRPISLMLNIIKERLTREIEITERLLDSINRVKYVIPTETGRDVVYWSTDYEEHELEVKKKFGTIKVEIDGYEIEDIDADEVMSMFKKMKKNIAFNFIYRYVAFFDTSGNIGFEYDEDYIAKLEMEAIT